MLSSFTNVAVLGCGLMGSAIAKKLASTGRAVTAWNRTSAAADKLAEFGIIPEHSLEAALRSSDCVVVVLSNYEICQGLLSPLLPLLQGKVVVNLTSGTFEAAHDFSELMTLAQVDYLDGSIWALPSGIGLEETCVAFSGSLSGWKRYEQTLKALGGASKYVGPRPGAANVLEAAFPGTFYMTAILSFIEGVALCKAYGISDEVVQQAVNPTLALLRDGVSNTLQKISTNDFAASEATQQVFQDAVASYVRNEMSPVSDSPMTNALRKTLDDSCKAGRSQEDVASTICRWLVRG
ncbi:NAD(P)-binding domain-containing protein [Pseudomonas sp. PhalM4]